MTFKTYIIILTEGWIKQLWIFLDENNIMLNFGKMDRLPLRSLGYNLLTNTFTDIGFKGKKIL